MKVSQIGQFGLIDMISKLIYESRQPQSESWQDLKTGVGDDCAVWQGKNTCYLSKVDSQVQNVHFTLDLISWRDLGWKALSVNLSDIAAMGGRPLFAMVSLGLPYETEVEDVMSLYKGLLELAGQTGTTVIGGHISTSPNLFIDLNVTGCTASIDGTVLARSKAQPGELIGVTGWLGSAAAGLNMLRHKIVLEPTTAEYLRMAFTHPEPRLEEGKLLLEQGVRCAIDISDGMLADLAHICKASGVSAEIKSDLLPIRPEVKTAFSDRAFDWAVSGGEDYQLLFTASASSMKVIQKICRYPVSIIGEIKAGLTGQISIIDKSGCRISPKTQGWDHFKKN